MILLSILNTLVPTAAVALIAWVSLRHPRVNATTRHSVWWVVLLSVIAIVLWPQGTPVASAPVQLPPASAPESDSTALWITASFLVWTGFAAYRTARIVVGYLWLRRIKECAQPWSQPGVVLSGDVATPMTAGFLHPVVILPACLPEKLTPAELEHVLLHEEAHIARRDNWTNLAARVVGVVAGLHPVAAFVLTRIARERELACDDWVVEAGHEPRAYAASLARIFELSRGQREPVIATGVTGSGLGHRVDQLLKHGRQFTRNVSRVAFCTIAALVGTTGFVGLHLPGWVAYAQNQPQPAKPVTQAAPAKPVSAASPARPVAQASPTARDAAADRLEALIARLEAVLDRMTQTTIPDDSTLKQLFFDKDFAAKAAEEQAQIQAEAAKIERNVLQAREAEMKAQEQILKEQQRELERQLMEIKRSVNFYDLEKAIAARREAEKREKAKQQ